MAENVGAIYYTVEADTQKLLDSVQPADASLSKLEKTFARTDKAANDTTFTMTKTAAAVKGLGAEAGGASDAMSGLTKILKGYLTLQGVNSLIQMAEGYNEMAERVRMASSSVAEYEMVQQRLLATANGTYRAMSEAQEVYILTADALRSMGYQTSDVLDITDSLSYALVKNAASGQRAQSAISAYAKSIQVGKVQADAWQSILAATPSIVSDIAAAAGLTAEEVRKLGAEGKLTAQQLNEGLRQSLDSNKAAADGMATTVRDAFTAMRNNLAAYVGEANQASGATGVLSSAILGLGENIDVIVKTLMAAGAGAMALYIARAGQAAIASAKAMLAARAEAAENLRLAQARVVATQAALAHAQANAGLTGSFASLTAAENANTAATAALSAAQRTAASAGATLLGVLGGPVGIIGMVATAAAGWYLFNDGADKARGSLTEMLGPLDSVIEKFKALNEDQRGAMLVKYADAQAQAVDDVSSAVDGLIGAIRSSQSEMSYFSNVTAFRKLESDISDAAARGESLTPIIQAAAQALNIPAATLQAWYEQAGAISDAREKGERAGSVLSTLRGINDQLAESARNAAAGQRELNAAFNDAQTDDYLKRLQERRQAIEDEGSAVKAAERYIASLKDVSEERIAQIREEAAGIDRLNSAKKAKTTATKVETEAERQAKQAAEERKRADEANIQTLDRMAQSLYQAGLQGEALAVAQARASLNEFATPEQVAQVEAMARALYSVQQAEQQRQKFGSGGAADQYIMGDVQPLSGGAFDEQVARYEAEAQAEQERYAAQLERLQEARELQVETNRSYDQIEEDAAQQHAARMAQIEQAKNQVMLSSASDAFGAMADVMKTAKGEQSGIYKAMFAASKAFAIAESIVKIQQGIASAAALPFPANIPAMATVAAQTASIVSTISGTSYGGGRQYGGPVSPGKGYRINENGAPEILNTASGRQYLLPNSRGEVVSNKDAAGGSGAAPINVTVQLIEDASRGGQVEQSYVNEQYVLNICVASIRRGTDLAQAVEGTYGIGRRGQ